ncbi:magnesium transporter [Candidatus Woesearchaeota archaeon]|nr:magnesium transporter [Candidatus Woesearchaeota archaeon]
MKSILTHLRILQKVQRHKHHPLIHKIHKKHGISKRTLLYVKEYGPKSNVPRTILRESIKILLLASLISSFGGLALEHVKLIFISIIPLVILFPALNDMIGDYGTIVSSRFSAMLHENKIRRTWWKNKELKDLFLQILMISLVTAMISSGIALLISRVFGYDVSRVIVTKIFFIAVIDAVVMVSGLFMTSVIAGLHFYHKKEDPNNFLIPITTSVADFGNMVVLAVLVRAFF